MLHHRPLTSGLFVCLLLLASACAAPETDRHTSASEPPTAGEGTGDLPDGFPDDFPLPPDFAITEATFTEGDAYTQANFLVRGTSRMSVAEVAEFYYEHLPEAGYDVQGQAPSSGATSAVVPFGNEAIQNGSVQLAAAREQTDVLMSLPLRD